MFLMFFNVIFLKDLIAIANNWFILTNEILRLEAETLINSTSSVFFFVAIDSLENCTSADIRKVYFRRTLKLFE
jgi:hypothetical protein